MATVSQVLKRKDGSEVKLVAQEFFGAGLHRSVGVHVLRRETPEQDWKLLSDKPHPGWKKMSLENYLNYGRSEMLQNVSQGEILKVIARLNNQVQPA